MQNFEKLKIILSKFDLFSESITLRLFQKKKLSTCVGGFFSLIMILILFLITQGKLNSVIYKTIVYIEKYDISLDSPPKLNIKNRFAITMNPNELNIIEGKRFFDFQMTVGKYNFFPNGTTYSEKKELNLISCNYSHFPMFSKNELTQMQISNWFCPNLNENEEIEIMGKYGDQSYVFLGINILECSKNNTNNFNNDCASKDELINLKKKNNGKIYVSLKMVNNLINFNNFDNPLVPYMDTIQYLINVEGLFIQKEVYLSSLKIQTDDTRSFNFMRGVFDYIYQNDFIYERKFEDYFLNENYYLNNQKIFTSIYLRSDFIEKLYERKYDCFQDYMGAFGSLYFFLYLFFRIVNKIFTKGNLEIFIGKLLYDFKKKKEKKSFNISDFEEKNKKKIKNNNINIFINLWHKIKIYFGFKIRKKDFIDLKLRETILMDIDILNILHRIQDLENIKKIIFNEDQMILFNFSAKPNFYERNFNKTRMNYFYKNKMNNKEKFYGNQIKLPKQIFYKVISAYKNIKDNKIDVNDKIINLLDKNMIKSLNLKIENVL